MPHGARIYNTLVEFIREKYWKYGYEEVISPNVYNFDLWVRSGHAAHYKENMFSFEVEKQEYGLKPMNCPGVNSSKRAFPRFGGDQRAVLNSTVMGW